jgi:[NiFe] hydrogenase small subunit
MQLEQEFERRLEQRGITRRSFLKYCTVVAGALGLGPAFGPKIYQAFAASPRPSVLWLHFAECTGCTEAVLRTSSPGFADLIFDVISLDYHETVMAAAGEQAEAALSSAIGRANNPNEYFCVVEGSIPTAAGGVYGMIGGRTMLSIAQDVCTKAQAVISIGTCASFGGIAAAAPNPTGAKGVKDALGSQLSVPVINISGCPPNPVNFVATIANYLLQGTLPSLDSLGRPQFAYSQTVHSRCPYREQESRCLEDQGCKGPRCRNNCPSVKFNDGTSWPVQAGHPCIGCSEPNFWDTMTPFYREHGEGDGHENRERDD